MIPAHAVEAQRLAEQMRGQGLVIEGFAGPGGWSTGLRWAGFTGTAIGFEKDRDACRTAVAAGHARVQTDVAAFPLGHLAWLVYGLIMSPPCPTFSTAGDGAGKIDLPNVLRLIGDFAAGREPGDYEWADERSRLTAEPMRYAVALRPRWIALEQVPPVLPIWQYLADRLRGLGYRVWTGILSAEEYGVPQTRKRAILVASLDGPVGPPVPTHQAYVAGRELQAEPDLFGDPLPPPVSMASALGWPDADGPSLHNSNQKRSCKRDIHEPAGTIFCSRIGNLRWMAPAGATSTMVDPRPDSDPAHTITGKGTAAWVLRSNYSPTESKRSTPDARGERQLDEPASTLTGKPPSWAQVRPSTTVLGDPRIGRPGHKDRDQGEAQFAQDSVRVTVQEAGVLQSFPADYPWQGTKTAQYRQAGDAVPPLLAAAILRPLLALSAGQVAA